MKLTRRNFLSSILSAVGAAITGWWDAGAVEAVPAEEKRVEISWTVPGPCWDCGSSDYYAPHCDTCEEYSNWTPRKSGYEHVGIEDALNMPHATVYIAPNEDGTTAWVSYDGGTWERRSDGLRTIVWPGGEKGEQNEQT